MKRSNLIYNYKSIFDLFNFMNDHKFPPSHDDHCSSRVEPGVSEVSLALDVDRLEVAAFGFDRIGTRLSTGVLDPAPTCIRPLAGPSLRCIYFPI